MWELDCEETWASKNWCFWTVVLEKTLESPLHYKEIQPVHPKGDQSWIFIGRTDAEAETLILWPPDEMSWLIGKDPDAGRDGGQEEKGTTEDEMAGWHHWLNGHGWIWVDSGSWWWTGRPGVLRFTGLQRVGHDWATELNWTDMLILFTEIPWTLLWERKRETAVSVYVCVCVGMLSSAHSTQFWAVNNSLGLLFKFQLGIGFTFTYHT